MRRLFAALLLLLPGLAVAEPSHGVAILTAVKLPADFKAFPYVNPDAPKGGSFAQAVPGTFDSLNPFVLRGTGAAGVARVWDTLMVPSADEPTAEYCRVCRTIDVAADGLTVTFALRPEARFNDGSALTADDVKWSFETLRDQGSPTYRQYYADVADVTVTDPQTVVFHVKTAENRELPAILGQFPIFPRAWWKGRDFTATLREPPLGSGPYRVKSVDYGRTLVLERVADWWARDLPTARGMHNFDTLRFEYFRDQTVAFEAFKAGQVDYRPENVSRQWATGYDFPAVTQGLIHRELLPVTVPDGMQGFFMNTRRKPFDDVRVRRAIAWMYDFEYQNKTLFYGAYERDKSFFGGEFASSGLPEGAELALLEPYRDKLPKEVFTTPFTLPVTDGSGEDRAVLRQALGWLREAGFSVRDRALTGPDGKPVSFEIIDFDPGQEKVALNYAQSLQRLGIDARVRTIDPAQFQKRLDDFDFDMASVRLPGTDSPGNEQPELWSCAAARTAGSNNLSGVCDPVIEGLLDRVTHPADRAALIPAVRALDRVLLWGWYATPEYGLHAVRAAYWDRFGHPDAPVRAGVDLTTWWQDAAKAARVDAARARQ